MEIKINCLKWGNLYGPEYVNRTYGGLKKHCKKPFHFVCYTDDADGISSKIEVRDIKNTQVVTLDLEGIRHNYFAPHWDKCQGIRNKLQGNDLQLYGL